MKKTLTPLLILFALCCIVQSFGPLSFDIGRLLTISFTLFYFLCFTWTKREKIFLSFIVLTVLIFTVRFSDPLFQLSCLTLLLSATVLYTRWRVHPCEEHSISLLAAALFTITFFLYEYIPECWYAANAYAHFFSMLCSRVYCRPLSLGPTSFGLFIFIIFVLYHLTLFILSKKSGWLRLGLALAYLICMNVLYTGLTLLAGSVLSKYIFAADRSTLFIQTFFFIMCIPSAFLYRQLELKEGAAGLPTKKRYVFLLPCIAVFLTVTVLLIFPFYSNSPARPTVAFYKKGSLDWDTPRFGTYGQRSGGMFGIMPWHLRTSGFTTRFIDALAPAELADANVLVIINLDVKLTRQEPMTLWTFVHGGGGLLLLGDHTDLGGLMQNFNDVLNVSHIKFNFDSAMPSRYTWDYLMDVRPHPLTRGFDSELTASWWVGASLSSELPAVPLLVGKYCYSDMGNRNNDKQAFLGNRRFDSYERLNDVVLAAWEQYGKGKIMVCADTSSFHNTVYMATYRFVLNTFRFLAGDYSERDILFRRALLCALAASIIGCAAGGVYAPAALTLIICLTVACSDYAESKKRIQDISFQGLQVAYIDHSHVERFDLMSWEDDSIGGLKNNIMRNGFFPLLMEKFDAEKLMQARVFIIIAPTQPFTEDEVAALKKFIESGGKIILSVGFEEKEASLPLLESFGLDIENVPLSWTECMYKDNKVQLHEAWPVKFSPNDSIDIICSPMEYPAVVAKKYGHGSLVVIGDSYFLLNENLEGEKNYSVPNILFLRDVLLQ
ncbi:MAG: DUF4350 domain-containing protein [Pseudomonadota bacterium]